MQIKELESLKKQKTGISEELSIEGHKYSDIIVSLTVRFPFSIRQLHIGTIEKKESRK